MFSLRYELNLYSLVFKAIRPLVVALSLRSPGFDSRGGTFEICVELAE